MSEERAKQTGFYLNKSIRYFSKKRRFFDSLHRTSQTIILAGGSSAFTALFSEFSKFALYATALITLISLIGYIFDFAGKMKLYDDLYRRTVNLASRFNGKNNWTEPEISKIIEERYIINADSPAIGRVADVICHNEEAQARGLPRTEMYQIGKIRKFFSSFIDLPPEQFEKIPGE